MLNILRKPFTLPLEYAKNISKVFNYLRNNEEKVKRRISVSQSYVAKYIAQFWQMKLSAWKLRQFVFSCKKLV